MSPQPPPGAATPLPAPVDILFRYKSVLLINCDATPAGQAWLDSYRREHPGLWNSFVGDKLTLTLTRYMELTRLVRRKGLTIDMQGRRGEYLPGDLKS